MDLMVVVQHQHLVETTGATDYGQFDRAVSQAVNNPAPSQPSGGDGWSPGVQHSGMPTTPTPSGPDPHDLSVVDPYGNIALEQEKIDFYEEPESVL